MRIVVIAAVASLLTGCAAKDDEYRYGEADMQAIALGDWQGTLELKGRKTTAFALRIGQAPPKAQPACGNRAFSHPLCMSTSSLGLEATLTTADGLFTDQTLIGTFHVDGLTLSSGMLSLDGAGITMQTSYGGGAFAPGIVMGVESGSFDMQRP